MKTKQLIERNLKFTSKYLYNGITRGSIESAQVTCCDNCGKLIANMVSVIQKETGKHFTIGTDCADTLVKAQCMYNTAEEDYNIDIYSFNKCARVATEVNKGKPPEVDMLWTKVMTDKGKTIECYTEDFKKYYPDLLK